MLIRNMTLEDIPQAAELEAQCFSLPWSEKSFRDSLQRKDTIFLVCEQECAEVLQEGQKISDKKIIGYIGMYFSFEEAEITNVAVSPCHRGKGVGMILLQKAKEAAKEQGAERILLEVRVSNRPAISLYEKSGFSRIGIRKNFYERPDEDADIMLCELIEACK
uniref:ribosomal protein S18-alanine N-acetyltransferase n=1 Tax=Agathobacter sp. TaxID=2021311 RepID=UPI0040570DE0